MEQVETSTAQPGRCRLCGRGCAPGYYWHRSCLARYRASVPYRERTIRRDGFTCASCGPIRNRLVSALYAYRWRHSPAFIRRRIACQRPLDADHIIPLALTGTHDPANLQMLCPAHHARKTRRDLAQMRSLRVSAPRYNPDDPIGSMIGLDELLGSFDRPKRGGAPRGPSGNGTQRGDGTGGFWLTVLLLGVLGAGWWHFKDSPHFATILGAAVVGLVLLGAGLLWLRITKAIRSRIWESLAPTFGMAPTQVRAIKARRYRVRPTEETRLPRLRPTRITITYARTFADHEPEQQTTVERRIAAKCGGTWWARWNTELDRVTLVSPDPLAGQEGLPWPALNAERTSLWDAVPLGVGVGGSTVSAGLVGKHMLIGGETGAGKSVSLSEVVAWAALDPDCTLHGIDGKGLVELGPWADSMADLVGTMPSAIELLRELVVVIDGRYEMLRMEGKRKTEPGDGMGNHLLVVDELARFTAGMGTKAERDEFIRLLADIIARGRAAGVTVVCATQRPAADVVPTMIRDLIGYRWALRTATPTTSDMILGAGHASQGANSARIAAEHRGLGFLLAEGREPIRLRSFLLTDADVAVLASRAAALRGVSVEAEDWTADADQPSPSP